MASREQHCYLFNTSEDFGYNTLSQCLLPATESVVVVLLGGWGVGGLNEDFWKREKSDRRVDNRKKENKATVTDRWETGWGDLNIIIHRRSDGSQKIKIEMPNLICVTFTVTLPCVSLSACHIPQYERYHHHHLLHTSAHPSWSYFSL